MMDLLLPLLEVSNRSNVVSPLTTSLSANVNFTCSKRFIYTHSNVGTLFITPSPNQHGSATITVTLIDSGNVVPNAPASSYTTITSFVVDVQPTRKCCFCFWAVCTCVRWVVDAPIRSVWFLHTTPPEYHFKPIFNLAIDCKWVWAEWGECSRSCGVGETTRQISIQQPAQYNGIACPATTSEVKTCNELECPVDCIMKVLLLQCTFLFILRYVHACAFQIHIWNKLTVGRMDRMYSKLRSTKWAVSLRIHRQARYLTFLKLSTTNFKK